MRFGKLPGFMAGAALLLSAHIAYAQEEIGRLASEAMLPCEGACPTVTRPERIGGNKLEFPREARDRLHGFSEGLVELCFTVRADGTVDDIFTLRVVGPDIFLEAAKEAVRRWTFKPATVNGKPVASFSGVRAVFLGDPRRTINPRTSAVYQSALKAIEDRKLPEARAALSDALKLPRLNFYERALVANLLALVALDQQEYLEARRASQYALAFPEDTMPVAIRQTAYRTYIRASLRVGDIGSVTDGLARLRNTPGFDESDPLVQDVMALRKQIDALPAYSTQMRVPDAAEAEGVSFALHRRAFTFTNVKGALSNFTLSCEERTSTSPISAQAEWKLPSSLSGCLLFVRGQPGTTFDIVQFKD